MADENSFDKLREMLSTDVIELDENIKDLLAILRGIEIDPQTVRKITERARNIDAKIAGLTTNVDVLYEKAIRDGLTSLFNRTYLDDSIVQLSQIDYPNPFAFLIGDVDNFHDYNGEYDHPQGDEALKMVGRQIKATSELVFPNSLIIPARYGGEEMCVLIVNYAGTLEDLAERTEAIRKTIEETEVPESEGIKKPNDGKFRHITITIGCGIQQKVETAGGLIGRVDELLMDSKKRNERNRVVYL